MYYAGTVGFQPRSPAFYSSLCSSLNGNDVPFLWYFMFKTQPSSMCHSLLGLPCVVCRSFCQLFPVSSQSFMSISAKSVATMHCAVCFKILSDSKENHAVPTLSNTQQKVSKHTLCGCYCTAGNALHLSLTETDTNM